MRLTEKDKQLLKEWGYSEDDLRQIEKAIQKTKTTYETYELNNIKKITRDEAIEILGRETYLSGICRSAFHRSACRESEKGQRVYFNSSKLFQ